MEINKLISELEDCIFLYLNPYNLGDDGKKVGVQSGKGSKGVTTDAMKSVGRNLARAKNQG